MKTPYLSRRVSASQCLRVVPYSCVRLGATRVESPAFRLSLQARSKRELSTGRTHLQLAIDSSRAFQLHSRQSTVALFCF